MNYLLKLIEDEDLDTAKILLEENDEENLLDGGQRTFEIRGYSIIYKKGIYWLLNPDHNIIAHHTDDEQYLIQVLYKIIN